MYNYYQISIKQTLGLEKIQNIDPILEINQVFQIELISLPILLIQIKSYIKIKKGFFSKMFKSLLLLTYNIIIYYLTEKGWFIIVEF